MGRASTGRADAGVHADLRRGRGISKEFVNVPYSVFVLSGLLPWQLFATALSMGGMSLVNQQHLLTKIYFPRLFIPTAVVGGALMDMGISSVLFVVLLAINGI